MRSFAFIAAALFALVASVFAAEAFTANSDAILADYTLGADTELAFNFGALPVDVAADSAIVVTLPTAWSLITNAVNETMVIDSEGVDVDFSITGNTLSISTIATSKGTELKYTMTNVRSGTSTKLSAIQSTFAVKNSADVDVATGKIFFHPVGFATFGGSYARISPFNVTAGSGFGLITFGVSPVTVAIPAGGSIAVSLPSTWTIASAFTCKASVIYVNPDRADITAITATADAETNNIAITFTNGIAATTETLRVFCYDAVKVASAPATYTDYATFEALDVEGEVIMEALRVVYPAIIDKPAPKVIVRQETVIKRDTLLNDNERNAFIAAFATAANLTASNVDMTRQTLEAAGSVKKSKFALKSRRMMRALADKQLRAEISIQLTADQSPEALTATLNDPATKNALAAGLSAAIGAEVAVESAGVAEIDSDCFNGVKDNVETDVDCGGSSCDACALGKTCSKDTDCASGYCNAKKQCAKPNSASAASLSAAVAVLAVVASLLL